MRLILFEEGKQTKQSCLKTLFGIPAVTPKELGHSRHRAAYLMSYFSKTTPHLTTQRWKKNKQTSSCILSHIKLHLMFRQMTTEALNSVCILYIYVLFISNSLSTGVSCLHKWRSALNKKRALGTSAKIFLSYA